MSIGGASRPWTPAGKGTAGLLALALAPACAPGALLDPEILASGIPSDHQAWLVELDRAGRATTLRVPVPPREVPERAAHAARSIQPDSDRQVVTRERGLHGTGFRFLSWYGEQVRTVLVSASGEVLHKTWQVPSGEAPPGVLAAVARAAPGEILRVEAGQGRGRPLEWTVYALGPDGLARIWRGDDRGTGTVREEMAASLRVEVR